MGLQPMISVLLARACRSEECSSDPPYEGDADKRDVGIVSTERSKQLTEGFTTQPSEEHAANWPGAYDGDDNEGGSKHCV